MDGFDGKHRWVQIIRPIHTHTHAQRQRHTHIYIYTPTHNHSERYLLHRVPGGVAMETPCRELAPRSISKEQSKKEEMS